MIIKENTLARKGRDVTEGKRREGKERRKGVVAPVEPGHHDRFDQLLDDAIFGVKSKKKRK